MGGLLQTYLKLKSDFFFFLEIKSYHVASADWNSLVDQAASQLTDPPAFAYRVMGLKVCVITPGQE